MPHTKSDLNIQWFRNAAPYINAHRGCTFVIEFGGEAILDNQFDELVSDIALLHSLGVKLVLVHGARPQIEQRLKEHGIESNYAMGLRITEQSSLSLIKEAVGIARIEIEAQFTRSLSNTPMSGTRIRVASGNLVTAKPYGVRDGIDYCYTGSVRRIEQAAIKSLLDADNIVLLSPLGYSATGETFNLRAEDIAAAAAVALNADKLIFMMEAEPLRDGKSNAIRELHTSDAQLLLLKRKKLPQTVQHDLQSAIDACHQGVKRVHMITRKQSGALLQELYTRDGIGTLITAGRYEDLRPATIADVGGILQLISPLENTSHLVRRSREQLELEIDNFMVIERDGMIVGCSALYPYKNDKVGEIACLVVHPDYRGQARGTELLAKLEQQAGEYGLSRLFALTTHTLHWFRERGFHSAQLDSLPVKKRELYNYQRNSKVFVKTLQT
ncbi:MAG: amino-acid N-acetyltransferase [Gammaproteobacteria bacterium]|nr:amino-acid N-acetyltransferase [Gammaproteobacteria bacterium]